MPFLMKAAGTMRQVRGLAPVELSDQVLIFVIDL